MQVIGQAGVVRPGADPTATTGVGPDATPSTYGGWRPRVTLGASSAGGLQLPAAQPTASWLYAPRGVWTDGTTVVAADTGNHRVLVWHTLPTADETPADVVLGQPDAHTEGPAAGGAGPARGLHLPTGVLVHEGRLVVADAWHHRVLVWDALPVRDTPPDQVLGQAGPDAVEPNAGGEASAATFYWPFGIAVVDGRFHVADTGNRRVLVWRDGIPEPGRPADVVLGQPTPTDREENRGGPVAADSFRWPHALAGTGDGGLLVADAGNHRVLRWDAHPGRDLPADAALGQEGLTSDEEFPYVSQAGRLRFPYGVATRAGLLAVADTANNRVLVHDTTSAAGRVVPDAVLGQPTAGANGENRWDQVAPDTFCWPYGLCLAERPGGGDLLAVADSGNNRVVVWERP